jgi:hypothetical protein
VFSASEAYLIEDGKVTTPVKGATLIGDGPTVLRQVSMVGNDLQLDQGVGILRQGRAIDSRLASDCPQSRSARLPSAERRSNERFDRALPSASFNAPSRKGATAADVLIREEDTFAGDRSL